MTEKDCILLEEIIHLQGNCLEHKRCVTCILKGECFTNIIKLPFFEVTKIREARINKAVKLLSNFILLDDTTA